MLDELYVFDNSSPEGDPTIVAEKSEGQFSLFDSRALPEVTRRLCGFVTYEDESDVVEGEQHAGIVNDTAQIVVDLQNRLGFPVQGGMRIRQDVHRISGKFEKQPVKRYIIG